ncbi:MAG: YraN family protein [Kiritimatiellia bacterium]
MFGAFWKRGQEPDPRHLEVGRWGEQVAEQHLRAAGLRIRARRLRVGKRDEIDLLAQDGDQLVFVEVKTRRTELFGRPIAAVDRAKRQHMSRAAVRYIKRLANPKIYFRFDVVEVIGSPEDSPERLVVRHIPNAFTLDRRYTLP